MGLRISTDIGVCIPYLGAGAALHDAGELSVLTGNKYSIPNFIHKTGWHCKKYFKIQQNIEISEEDTMLDSCLKKLILHNHLAL